MGRSPISMGSRCVKSLFQQIWVELKAIYWPLAVLSPNTARFGPCHCIQKDIFATSRCIQKLQSVMLFELARVKKGDIIASSLITSDQKVP